MSTTIRLPRTLPPGASTRRSTRCPNLAYAAQQRSDTFAVVTPPFGQPTYFSWVGRLDDKTLIDAINAAILAVEADGTMAKIQKTWFGQTMDLPKTVPEPQHLTAIQTEQQLESSILRDARFAALLEG